MAKFVYNNCKNANNSYISFEFNYSYHLYISFKNKVYLHFRSYLANKLVNKLKNLMIIWQQNKFYIKKLQNKAYNKRVKLWSYVLSQNN